MFLAGHKCTLRCSHPKELYIFKQLEEGQCGGKMRVGWGRVKNDLREVGQTIPGTVRPGLSLRPGSGVILRSTLGVSLKLGPGLDL